MRIDILIACLAAIAVLVWIYRRDKRRLERERAQLFEDVRGLLGEAEISRAANEYPKLRGRYCGHEVAVDAIIDHIAVRKLPSLWLRVTVMADLPVPGACDVMARAHNVEFFSPHGDFDHVLKLPAGWPDHLTVKCEDPDAIPPEEILTRHISVFDDLRMKELLVTQRGVRLVRQAAQGARAEYMVLRQALFGPVRIPREQLAAMLDAAIALVEDLKQPAAPHSNGAAA
ncbi:hypothetical protein [Dongia sp. agr-C8]